MSDRRTSRRGGGPGERPVRPFDALRARLAPSGDISPDGAVDLRLDPHRRIRTGVPEVVLAGAKAPVVVRAALTTLADANGRAIASRCEERHFAELRERLPAGFRFECHADAAAAIVVCDGHERAVVEATGGRVGVLTAGSSDAGVAAEAALIAHEMGCEVARAGDVGVAGLHRLVEPLEAMIASGVDAIVIAAGMDGALPSVVAGLVDVPVIGVPVSTGYGLGGAGEAALLAMLQSCALGLVVVNIDNGIGAGAAAARIANRTAAARSAVAHDDISR